LGLHAGELVRARSSYALAPERASQIREFQDLVAAFHRAAWRCFSTSSIITSPAGHLERIDKLYILNRTGGNLANWSGCGNDLRAGAACPAG